MSTIEIGKLLRASTTGFVVGCKLSQITIPSLGEMVRVDLEHGYQVFGLLTNIHIDDDGLVRQLVTGSNISPEIIADNRLNRNVPVEMDVLAVGYILNGRVSHLLPPRPPLSLDAIFQISTDELVKFTENTRFGYFRHILRADDIPTAEVLAAHLQQAYLAHQSTGNPGWLEKAAKELITLLRDDYEMLINVLGALTDMGIELDAEASNG